MSTVRLTAAAFVRTREAAHQWLLSECKCDAWLRFEDKTVTSSKDERELMTLRAWNTRNGTRMMEAITAQLDSVFTHADTVPDEFDYVYEFADAKEAMRFKLSF